MTVFTANCIGNVANCLYPNEIAITDEKSAKEAFSHDTVYAKYKGNYRSIDNFLYADVIPADCDNGHSDNEKDWITENDIAEMFPNVQYILHYSRNHMKQKGKRSPRPRFHVNFSIEKTEDEQVYSELKHRLIALYPFFDDGAKDSARFMFGTKDPQIIFHSGSETLSSFIKEIENEEKFAKMGVIIPEGSRNSTMSRIGAKIIKRYGDTNKAKESFFEMAAQCSPPLNDNELEKIWQGKQNFYKKISSQPGYVAPDKYNQSESITWEAPIPFEAYNLPSFPTEALPEVIQKYVLAVSESTQTSPDMAAVESLGITSLCVQGKYNICGNADWNEPLNTYIVVILPPAERKSSVLSMMTSPVERYETEKNAELSTEIIKSSMMLDKLEKEKKALVEKASKGNATEEDVQAKATEIATYRPVKPIRLFVDDVTSEKLTSVLAENKGRAAIMSAEGGIFDIIGGLYTKNVNIDVFLKGHSGDTIRVDRIGRASESIIHPALTMLLAVQPEVLNGLMSNNTFRGRGLTARFLYSMPKSSVGSRSFSSVPIPEKVKEGYQKLVTTLLENKSEDEPLHLSDGANTVLENLFNEIEKKLRGELSDIPDWAGKFVGVVLRIAGLLHIMENPDFSEFTDVSESTMVSAEKIGKYFLEHAKAAYSLMGADTVNKNAEYLWNTVAKNNLSEFSRRDAMRLCRHFKTADSLQPVLNRLCEYGYIAPKQNENTLGFGRKPSEIYQVNPLALSIE